MLSKVSQHYQLCAAKSVKKVRYMHSHCDFPCHSYATWFEPLPYPEQRPQSQVVTSCSMGEHFMPKSKSGSLFVFAQCLRSDVALLTCRWRQASQSLCRRRRLHCHHVCQTSHWLSPGRAKGFLAWTPRWTSFAAAVLSAHWRGSTLPKHLPVKWQIFGIYQTSVLVKFGLIAILHSPWQHDKSLTLQSCPWEWMQYLSNFNLVSWEERCWV